MMKNYYTTHALYPFFFVEHPLALMMSRSDVAPEDDLIDNPAFIPYLCDLCKRLNEAGETWH